MRAATDALSTTFSALADPTRRAILLRLADGAATVKELSAPFEMSGPAVSKHLRVLERAGTHPAGTGGPVAATHPRRRPAQRGRRVGRGVPPLLGRELRPTRHLPGTPQARGEGPMTTATKTGVTSLCDAERYQEVVQPGRGRAHAAWSSRPVHQTGAPPAVVARSGRLDHAGLRDGPARRRLLALRLAQVRRDRDGDGRIGQGSRKPPERLVTTERWGPEWPETINTLRLTESDGRTTIDPHGDATPRRKRAMRRSRPA